MKLLSLRVNNIGLFQGSHTFDLAPQPAGEQSKNLTVFTGHNGAGKSTLFLALSVALHGSLALGERVGQQEYTDFLQTLLHRRTLGGATAVSPNAEIALSLEYVQSGQPLRIAISRQWERTGRTISERLSLTQNGEPVAGDAPDHQAWLNELLPPAFAPICFFDAENLDTLASPTQQHQFLKDTLYRLLGLDLVKRLYADLEYHTLRQGGSHKAEHLRATVLEHQQAIDLLDAELTDLKEQLADITAEQGRHEIALRDQERRLAAEGGLYAARRAATQERLTQLTADLEKQHAQIAELCAGLLPFALAPALCHRLQDRLAQEADIQRRHNVQALWEERVGLLQNYLTGDQLWEGIPIPKPDQQLVADRVADQLMTVGGFAQSAQPASLVHHLAEPEQARLESWIVQATETLPEQAERLWKDIHALETEQARLTADLAKAPSDELLAPLHTEIARLAAALNENRHRQADLQEQIGSVQYQRNDQNSKMQRVVQELTEAQSQERHLVLAENTKIVLRAYEDKLLRQRMEALETRLVDNFNRLCQKEHLLASATINPDDCSIALHSRTGHRLRLSNFSAGERQLYALALLQALRQVSGRSLPLAIDTPLARLDAIHRDHLLHDYLPAVSDQVLLFATNVEADQAFLNAAAPSLAHAYHLEYIPTAEETRVSALNNLELTTAMA